ncbi:MAG: hypothetical protein ACOC4G_13465, partial [Bacillota bacterium]
MIKMVVIMICIIFIFATGSIGAKQKGIAALYPGDEGIEEHESIVFTEKFEKETLSEVIQNWTWSRGDEDHRLSLDSEIKGPAGTTGNNSLKMTVLRDKP